MKPIKPIENLTRSHINLIDLQCNPDGPYKWVLIVQDHSTKFIHLRALCENQADEIAMNVMKIFLVFGVPQILQSDHGKTFTAGVIEELKSLLPDAKILIGCPSHGSDERANAEIKRLLGNWIRTKKRNDWSFGLDFVANQYNRVPSDGGFGDSPYKRLFGRDYPVIFLSLLYRLVCFLLLLIMLILNLYVL